MTDVDQQTIALLEGAIQPYSFRLGEELRSLRKERGLSLEQLAAITGLFKMNMSRYERGINIPSIPLLETMCKGLGINMDHLLTKLRIETGKPRKPWSDYTELFNQIENLISKN